MIERSDFHNSSLFISQSTFSSFPRHIAAKGFFSEKIAGRFESPGPAAAAYAFEFTGIAFALQLIIIAQVS